MIFFKNKQENKERREISYKSDNFKFIKGEILFKPSWSLHYFELSKSLFNKEELATKIILDRKLDDKHRKIIIDTWNMIHKKEMERNKELNRKRKEVLRLLK